jgi:cell division protein FtsL
MKKVKLSATQMVVLLAVFDMYSLSGKVDEQLADKTVDEGSTEEFELKIHADELEEVKNILDLASEDDGLKDNWEGIKEIIKLIDATPVEDVEDDAPVI